MTKLIIVESPAKIKKIKEYLGENWAVKASVGHISDLPAKELGVDKENGFKLTYEVSKGKENVVKDLTIAIKHHGKENVYLATDPDREGEAISFHLCRNLGLDYKTVKRVTFQELTEKGVNEAVLKPRTIDIPLVSAQEARRVVDRLVGYEISPILWRKIESDTALSAGRVQSVALKLIVERERENLNFVPAFTYKISGLFQTPGSNKLRATSPLPFSELEEVKKYLLSTSGRSFVITSVTKEPKKTNPQPPFSTSTMQQDANRKLKFPVTKTMEIAQRLFEAGHITYLRTDSVNLSETATELLSNFIVENYGQNYLEVRKFKNKNESAQEAHEAIRPTHFENKVIEGTEEENALYNLIYLRAVASQMKAKETAVTTISINKNEFIAKASIVTFEGYTKAYADTIDEDNEEEEEAEIKEALKEGDKLINLSLLAKQTFTKPKPRFGEDSLVKELEALGIGRPSTYGSILKNLIEIRKYVYTGKATGVKYSGIDLIYTSGKVTEEKTSVTIGQATGKLIPNPIAFKLIDFLQSEFSNILDYDFTAKCEEDFDLIAQGKEKYVSVVSKFYSELSKYLKLAESNHSDIAGKERKTVDIGEYEKKLVSAGKGEHGVYVRHNDKFYNIPDVQNHLSVTLEIAIKAIINKREQEQKKKEEQEANTIKVFGKFKIVRYDTGIFVLNGIEKAPVPKWDLDKVDSYTEDKCKEVIKNFKAFKKKNKK